MDKNYQQKYLKYKSKYLQIKKDIEPDSYNSNDNYFYYTNNNSIENFSQVG